MRKKTELEVEVFNISIGCYGTQLVLYFIAWNNNLNNVLYLCGHLQLSGKYFTVP